MVTVFDWGLIPPITLRSSSQDQGQGAAQALAGIGWAYVPHDYSTFVSPLSHRIDNGTTKSHQVVS